MKTDRMLVDYLRAAHVKFNGGQGDDAPLIVTSFSQVAPMVPRRVRARYADVLRASGEARWLEIWNRRTSPTFEDSLHCVTLDVKLTRSTTLEILDGYARGGRHCYRRCGAPVARLESQLASARTAIAALAATAASLKQQLAMREQLMRTDRQLVDYLRAAHVWFNGGQGDARSSSVTRRVILQLSGRGP